MKKILEPGKHQKQFRRSRTGVSAIEFAITAPILLLLVFGGLELSRANLMRNTCEFAALEGAREGILPGATKARCESRAQEQLDLLGVKNPIIVVDPPVILEDTDEITVTVRIPMTDNALPMSKFVLGKTMERSITLKRETTAFGGPPESPPDGGGGGGGGDDDDD